jgi:tetratricopeptide (TPR) repeat protein
MATGNDVVDSCLYRPFPMPISQRNQRTLASAHHDVASRPQPDSNDTSRLNESSNSESTVGVVPSPIDWVAFSSHAGKDVWFPPSVQLCLVRPDPEPRLDGLAGERSGEIVNSAVSSSLVESARHIVQSSCRRHLFHYCQSAASNQSLHQLETSESLDLFLDKDMSSVIVQESTSPRRMGEMARQFLATGNYEAAILLASDMLKVYKDCKEPDSGGALTIMTSQLAVLCLATGKHPQAVQYSETAVQSLPVLDVPPSVAQRELTLNALIVHGLVQWGTNGNIDQALYAWREAIHIAIPVKGYNDTVVATLLNNLGVLHWRSPQLHWSDCLRSIQDAVQIYRYMLASCVETLRPHESVEDLLYRLATTMGNLGLSYRTENHGGHVRIAVALLHECQSLYESLPGDTSREQELLLECIENLVRDDDLAKKEGLYDEETQLNSSDEYSNNNPLNRTTTSQTDNSLQASADFQPDASFRCESQSEQDTSLDIDPSAMLFGNCDGVPQGNLYASRWIVDPVDNNDFLMLGSLAREQSPEERVRETVFDWFGERVNNDENGGGGDDRELSFDIHVESFDESGFPSMPAETPSPTKLRRGRWPESDLHVKHWNLNDGEDALDADLRLSTIYNQVVDYLDHKRIDKALALLHWTLQSHRKKYGNIHHLVGTALHNLGLVYFFAQRHAEALDVLEDAVLVRSEALGPDHPELQASLLKIALLHVAMGKLTQSYDALCEIRDKLLQILPHGHLQTSKVINNIGVVAFEMGNYGKAMECFRAADTFQKQLLDSCFHDESNDGRHFTRSVVCSLARAYTLSNLGFVYAKQGKPQEAKEAYQQSYNLLQSHLSSDQFRIAEVRQNIEFLEPQCKAMDAVETSVDSSLDVSKNGCFCSP